MLGGFALAACSSTPSPFASSPVDGGVLGDGSSDDAASDAALALDGAPLLNDAADAGVTPCLGDDLAPGSGPVVCPANACTPSCERVLDHYRAGVAKAIVTCIDGLSPCTEPAQVVPCTDQALARACSEPSSVAYCKALVGACDPADAGGMITLEGCRVFANGLSASGRSAFAACIGAKIDAGNCAMEVGSCADDIRQ
jgi:hypothetical protein